MDQVKQEVRKSIVRISFLWKTKPEDKRFMVIPGIILSIEDDGSAVIAANSTVFEMKRKVKPSFVVNFPNAIGYEEGQELNVCRRNNHHAYKSAPGFYIFEAKPHEDGYIEAVRFQAKPVRVNDIVHLFVFPREGYITPTGYCEGSVTEASSTILLHDCPMHEYAYLGSPLFNLSGDLVAITYLDQGHGQAWTVWQLRHTFRKLKCTIVSDEIGEPAGAEAQVEE